MGSFLPALQQLFATLMAVVAFFGGLFSSGTQVVKGDIQLAAEHSYNFDTGISFGQGITTDGEYFYGFGAFKLASYCSIAKIDVETGEVVNQADFCVPKELALKGYDHFGDGDYDNGKLYVACEDLFFTAPAVMVYDAETLEYLDCYIVPEEGVGDAHIPWCLVKDGVIYYSQFDNVTEIRMISVEDGSYLGAVQIDDELFDVQGGDFDGNYLYLATNRGDGKVRKTYRIDMTTGDCELVFERDLGIATAEAEGLCIYEFDNGTKFHYVDIDGQINIRSYK